MRALFCPQCEVPASSSSTAVQVVLRLMKALASWSSAIDIHEAGRPEAMEKHIVKSLGSY